MAVDLTGVLDADCELFLEVDKDVSNVLLGEGELGLRTFTLPSHVESKSFLRAGGVAESSARVVIRALRLEGHAASDLGVGPDFSLERLDREDLVLEQHRVVLYCLSDPLVLSLESCNSLLLCPLSFEPQLSLIIRVIAVQALFAALILILALEHGSLFRLFLTQLHVEPCLFLVLLFLGGKGPPRELNRHLTLVDDGVVLMRVERDAGGIHVDVRLREVDVVVVGLASDRNHRL